MVPKVIARMDVTPDFFRTGLEPQQPDSEIALPKFQSGQADRNSNDESMGRSMGAEPEQKKRPTN